MQTNAFWKFLGGFAALLTLSFGIILAVGYYEVEVKGGGTPPRAVQAAPMTP